jgi:Secretion system C-terminal sorting domain
MIRTSFLTFLMFISFISFAQLPFSTVREVYNFDVGDTIEMACSYIDGNCSVAPVQNYMNVILTKDTTNNLLTYTIRNNGYRGPSYSCPSIPSAGWSYVYTIIYHNLDSSVFWYHTYHSLGYDTNNFYYVDTAYLDTSINGRKVNEHFDGGQACCRIDTAFAEGLGEISNSEGYEDYSLTQGGCQLAYYHKANGERWGRPLSIDISADVNNLDAVNSAISVSPNPAYTQLYVIAHGTIIKSVLLYSVTGSLLRTIEQPADQPIDISNLSSGLYIAQMLTEQGTLSRKWVKM